MHSIYSPGGGKEATLLVHNVCMHMHVLNSQDTWDSMLYICIRFWALKGKLFVIVHARMHTFLCKILSPLLLLLQANTSMDKRVL